MKHVDAAGIAKYLKAQQKIAIFCHENPDGDALGSSIALKLALDKLGKDSVVICADPVPDKYEDIPHRQCVTDPEQMECSGYCAVGVDCADPALFGRSKALYLELGAHVCIDHHRSNCIPAEFGYVDDRFAACAEMIYQVIQFLGEDFIDREIATCLMIAISTDTGHFSFKNTNAHTFFVASKLMECGVDVATMCNRIYRQRSLGSTRLIGRAIKNLEVIQDDRAAVMYLSQNDLQECGAKEAEIEGIIDYATDIDTVQVSALVRETQKGGCKVSFRAKAGADIDVSELAKTHGGGGHQGAAGMRLDLQLPDAILEVMRLIRLALE